MTIEKENILGAAAGCGTRPRAAILGVILAGGQARRMGGGDKPLTGLGGKTLLAHVLERATPQCAAMIINANGDASRFKQYGLPVIADSTGGFLGPLAGVLAALDWAAAHAPHCKIVASFAGDAPFIPRNLVARLYEARAALSCESDSMTLARATSFGRRHPVFALWPVALRAELRHALVNNDVRKIDLFTKDYPMAEADFDGIPDPFFNINTTHDRDEAARILRAENDTPRAPGLANRAGG